MEMKEALIAEIERRKLQRYGLMRRMKKGPPRLEWSKQIQMVMERRNPYRGRQKEMANGMWQVSV